MTDDVRYHLTHTGFHAGATLCCAAKLPGDRHAAYNGDLTLAPLADLIADGCCPACALLWTDAGKPQKRS